MGEKILSSIARMVLRWPGWIVSIGVCFALGGFLLGAFVLEFHGDRDEMIGEDKEFRRHYAKVFDQFGSTRFVVLVVDVDDNLDRSVRFARTVGKRWRESELVEEVYEDRDRDFFKRHGLYYMSLPDLEDTAGKIEEQKGWLKGIATSANLVELLRDMEREFDSRAGAQGVDVEVSALRGVRRGVSFFGQVAGALRGEKVTVPEEAKPVPVKPEEEFHLSDTQKLLFVYAMPRSEPKVVDPHAKSVEEMRRLLEEVRETFPAVRAGLTGRPVLDHDEVQTTHRDMGRAGPIALLGIVVLFLFAFENLSIPFLSILSLGVGIGWSYGATALMVGHLNLVTSVFALILLGLGVDFGIYLVVRFCHERSRGLSLEDAWKITMSGTARATCLGAFTTSLAFYTTLLVDFKGVQELGLIAGTGVLLCLVAMLTVLPALVVLVERIRGQKDWSVGRVSGAFTHGPSRLVVRFPGIVIGVCAFLVLLTIPILGEVGFSYDHLALQPPNIESVRYEHRIMEESDRSLWFGVSVVNPDELHARVAAFEALEDVVGTVESPQSVLPDQLPEKVHLVRRIRGQLPATMKPFQGSDLAELYPLVQRLVDRVEEAEEEAAESGRAELSEALADLGEQFLSIHGLLGEPSAEKREKCRQGLFRFETEYLGAVRQTVEDLMTMAQSSPPKLTNLPEFYRQVFLGRDGGCQVQVYPKNDLNQPQEMERFLLACEAVDPGFTGEPSQFFYTTRLMKEGFEEVTLYAFLAIFLVVLFFFRNLVDCLLMLLPLGVGVVWLIGIMWLGGWQFNLANFFALPVILGIGIDIGIHVVSRFRAGCTVVEIQETAGRAILTTSLTSMIGFGSIMIAQHQGLASLGRLVLIGISTSMVASVLVLPAVLTFLQRKRNR